MPALTDLGFKTPSKSTLSVPAMPGVEATNGPSLEQTPERRAAKPDGDTPARVEPQLANSAAPVDPAGTPDMDPPRLLTLEEKKRFARSESLCPVHIRVEPEKWSVTWEGGKRFVFEASWEYHDDILIKLMSKGVAEHA